MDPAEWVFASATIGGPSGYLYHPLVPVEPLCAGPYTVVLCGPVWCGSDGAQQLTRTKVRPTGDADGPPDRSCASGQRPAGQAAVWADVAAGGCGIRPRPRGIGETTYRMAPNTMIDRTLITQSRIVIAVASGSGTP